ncbi:MAG: sugar ABC transporter substrate-binding protein, partial [Rhodospirillaceae bacterium]|nr:sugar ABC transporter substrate-binding protein [Rhodospirillaceae bacterium]
MKKILSVFISSFVIVLASFSANAVKVGAIYMDSQGFYGGVQKGIITGAGDMG